jgi:Fuc2NAc and GlcNAc transferase
MIYLLVAVFTLSFALTWAMRHYALAKNIMDCPNDRSSHVVPTPRGGGVAFVTAFLIVIPFLAHYDLVTVRGSFALVGAGLFLAILGFLDDHRHIAAHWRLLGHFLACTLAVYWLGGMPAISVLSYTIPTGWVVDGLAVIYLVWLLNLYNFMDGIDGLASVEACSVCLGAAFLYWLSGEWVLMIVPLILTAAVAGFLCWNLPPARIFMGDAGSGFLGFILGVLSIRAAAQQGPFFWSWLILLGVFFIDATLTLLRRMMRGDKMHVAHRTHAYQKAACLFGSHLPVTVAVFLINLLWLCPIAIGVGLGYVDGVIGLLIAYVPLVILSIQFKAGQSG